MYTVALSRYQNIINAEDAWQIDYDSVEANEAKPTKSALRLKDLLETITDRYRPLTSFTQRLRFLIDIQINVLDQYHERLNSSAEAFKVLSSSIARAVQGTSKEDADALKGIPGLERLCRVYGSAMYLEGCMRDWGEDVVGPQELKISRRMVLTMKTSSSLKYGRSFKIALPSRIKMNN